jgi:sialic acid synthase SpsE
MEEEGFTKYVEEINAAKEALQKKEVKITDSERYTRKRARRSLYAARDIQAGEIIKDEDVLVVRPEGILDADQIDIIVGKPTGAFIKKYEAFTFDNVSID